MTEKIDFIDQTYRSEASKHDFKTTYRDMNMVLIWKDKKLYGSNVDRLAEKYNDRLKKKKYLLAIKNIFYGNIILL